MTEREQLERLVQAVYDGDPNREWERAERHRTEFAVTQMVLDAHLPPPPARVLDCGGGPGRYAIYLARRGYQVTLFDLSPELLNRARQQAQETGARLSGIQQGTATDLSRFNTAQFDAVLLLGPLYHLLEATDRQLALSEAYRVVKPGGRVFAAFITRYAAHIDAVARYPKRAADMPALYRQIATAGRLSPRNEGSAGFIAYFAHPDEVVPLCRAVGLEVLEVLGVEGVAAGREKLVNALTGEAWDFWVETNYSIAQDPSSHGGAEHLLAVCCRPQWRATLRYIAEELESLELDYRVVGGASLALRGLPVSVHDLDLEMTEVSAAYRFQERFATTTAQPVAWRETERVRSHYGRFEIRGMQVEVMGGLTRRIGARWVPSFLSTHEVVKLEGASVSVLALEEEMLAYLRRGRLDRAALALQACDADRLLSYLAEAHARHML